MRGPAPNSQQTLAPNRRFSAVRLLGHPLPLAAVLVLVVNDHVLKGAGLLPTMVTGKLSDIAGLFFFPLLLAAILTPVVRGKTLRLIVEPRTILAGCIFLTGVVFASIKTLPFANAVACTVLGPTALDPTDLLALPVLLLTWRFSTSPGGPALRFDAPRWIRYGALLTASVASMATSQRPEPRRPSVQVPPSIPCAKIAAIDCAVGERTASVRVRFESVTGAECNLQTRAATLRFVDRDEVQAEGHPQSLSAAMTDPTHPGEVELVFPVPQAPEKLPAELPLHLVMVHHHADVPPSPLAKGAREFVVEGSIAPLCVAAPTVDLAR